MSWTRPIRYAGTVNPNVVPLYAHNTHAALLTPDSQIKLEEMQKAAQRHIAKNIKLVERLCAHLMAGLDEDDEEDS